MAERRTVKMGPNAASVGSDNQQTALTAKDAPGFAKKLAGLFGVLQGMDHENAVNGPVRQGKVVLLNQGDAGFSRIRP